MAEASASFEQSEFPDERFEEVVDERGLTATVGLWALGLCVALSALFHLVLALRIATPWIFSDEWIYAELARSFAESGTLRLRETPGEVFSVLYPVLVAPAWLAGSMDTTYDLAKAINTVAMSLTAIPVYFWARRLTSPGLALMPAVLTLLMPAQVLSGMVMTENLFFPVFVLAAFAIGLMLERPTVLRQVAVLAAIGVAFLVRFHGVVLLAIVVSSVGLKLLFDLLAEPPARRETLRGLRAYLPLLVIGAVAAGGYVLYKTVVQDVSWTASFGAYRAAVESDYDLRIAARWVAVHYGEFALAVGLVPVVALLILTALAGRRSEALTRAERAFVAVALSAVLWLVAVAGVFASKHSLRIEERYMMHACPLAFIALAVWLHRGAPRPALATTVATAVPFGLIVLIGLPPLLNLSILSDTFAFVPLVRLESLLDITAQRVEVLVGIAAFAAALLVAYLPRAVLAVLAPAAIALYLAAGTWAYAGAIRDYSRLIEATVTDDGNLSWIDDEIGDERRAAYVLTEGLGGTPVRLWTTEIWNRSVGTVLYVEGAEPVGLPHAVASIDPDTGRVAAAIAVPTRYAVTDSRLQLAGTPVASERTQTLWRLDGPLRLASSVNGVYADGWMANDAVLSVFADPQRRPRVAVTVGRKGWGGPSKPGRVTIEVGPSGAGAGLGSVTAKRTWVVRSGRERRFVLPAPSPPFRVRAHVSTTFSPADHGLADPRRLGAQVDFRLVPDRS